ncbi:CBS domain-containing protein [Paenibacillus sp. J45TS6]|uniref:CBS domain-containing protein n=1 Tax=Paenibacillus sp. J45TS6 TaxID=2807196 RepID=UPI001B228825|nr:CBS domain-containing protein [Paenibacillus sp. J45TS6]GIP41880.1 CBS domain-containing protein [Paenibacillus sp. J45TS6]
MNKNVSDVMSTNVVPVSLDKHVYDVALNMKEYDTEFIPIVETEDHRKLVGVVTDRDLVLRGIASKNPGSTKVSEVMTADVHTVNSTASIDEAAKMMAAHQVRRLPVVDNGELVGILSLGDIATESSSQNNAGSALTDISEPSH